MNIQINELQQNEKTNKNKEDTLTKKNIRRNTSRNRVDTDFELHIVNEQFVNRINIGRPTPCITNTQFVLYKLLYHKYVWHSFMFLLFFLTRISFGYSISLQEWYNDTLFFVISNNYLYKRLHWNNDGMKYFDKREIRCYISFLLTYIGMFVFDIIMPQFHFSRFAISNYDISEYICFCGLCLYVCIIQFLSILHLYNSKNNFIFRKQLLKYLLLNCYIFLEYICYGLYYVLDFDIKLFSMSNNYRIHHWFFGLLLLIFTELEQQYHTIIQYIHYAMYLQGVACYGYDSLLK